MKPRPINDNLRPFTPSGFHRPPQPHEFHNPTRPPMLIPPTSTPWARGAHELRGQEIRHKPRTAGQYIKPAPVDTNFGGGPGYSHGG